MKHVTHGYVMAVWEDDTWMDIKQMWSASG